MADEDHTNKPDLRATPDPKSDSDAGQKDAPLPAFIYGRDGQGDGNGHGATRAGDRQNLNARIADMDRKTLLGLITGAGMLGLVLFFAGMLVGAGLFMDSDEGARTTQTQQPEVEMLASAPEEPAVIAEETPEAAEPSVPEISADSEDPVGDLIAQRTEALSDEAASGEEAPSDVADATDAAEATTSEEPAIAAPEIRDVNGTAEAPEAPAAPDAPAVDATEESAPSEATETAEQSAAPAETEPATETAEAAPEAAPSAPAGDTVAAADTDKPFSVQVGAFKVHENASQRAEELRGEGLQVAVVVRGPEDEGAWYYVRIGAYASLAEARDDAAKIKADHSIDGFPVRAEPNDRVVN
ncbi:hypothetical protein HED22_19380 [Thalassospira sp. HF15]|uniref:SPOR domain-containing protein n=1 Tax=Thalassospira sp. HF15 TaxID=2722755 RepID=UPI0014304A12|nr:SPOR domain-containing protein [Thalassospira sp. HF15]NIY77822.1 hypothetical protein [Thalassospira sp. HF15]